MYLTFKIHKNPLKTRANVSYSGSICHGLACWVDVMLKRIIKHLDYVCTSSKEVVDLLKSKKWNKNCVLFSNDAVSMYTNIHFGHANDVIFNFLTTSKKGIDIVGLESIPVKALMRGLEIVMVNNVFKFGDTYWLQTAGTAMGGPPAPSYATLYFGIHEQHIIPTFPELQLYFRYIDDTFNMWKPLSTNSETDKIRKADFLSAMNNFGKDHEFFTSTTELKPLQWTMTDVGKSVIFLDLHICLNGSTFSTTIYEKKLNLHLYIPPHSYHSPGVLKGVVFGSVHRALNLNTDTSNIQPFLKKTFYRL